ncbi:hypothetical protein [Streptomyces olivaceus]|uniref:hypothetical protein n=1 Tax=Streptomyces olivaceus TaxID=47716 RepID=UPI003722DE99
MSATLTLSIRGPLKINGAPVRCPGRDQAPAPFRLTLMVSGTSVMASCEQKHKGADGGRKAKCFFAVKELTPAMVRLIVDKTQPGAFRVTMPDGKVLEGKRDRTARPAPAGQGGTAASAFAAKKAAARGGKGAAVPARRGGGGTLAAALNTVTAVAGTATAAANAIGAGANAVGASANAVGKGFDMGREGFRAGQSAIRAADNAGARRFARDNRDTGDEDKSGGE